MTTTTDTEKSIDKCIEILRATHDGDDLEPRDLSFIQDVVNHGDPLPQPAQVKLDELYRAARSGNYRKPWLQGVEHLTRDLEGYVYWKGQEIEHWSGSLPYSAEGKVQAEELARRCLALESRQLPLSSGTVIWHWEKDKTDGENLAHIASLDFVKERKQA